MSLICIFLLVVATPYKNETKEAQWNENKPLSIASIFIVFGGEDIQGGIFKSDAAAEVNGKTATDINGSRIRQLLSAFENLSFVFQIVTSNNWHPSQQSQQRT